MEYTTLDSLKEFLDISTDHLDDNLSALITRATKLLDLQFGDNLWVQSKTRYIDGNGTNRLIMENTINSVTSIEMRSGTGWSPLAVDFIDGALVYLTSDAPKGQANIKITYTKWYEEIPADLQAFFNVYCSKLITIEENKPLKKYGHNGQYTSKKINGLSVTYRSPWEIAKEQKDFGLDLTAVVKKYKNFTLVTM